MSGGGQKTFLLQNPTMNSNPSPVVMPVELNKNLLNTLFKFNPLSTLKCFLVSKTGVEKTYYSLAEILTILKNIIRGEGMFDHANPSVIICSPELERALNMKALHVTEIRDLVLSQITRVPDQSLREKFSQQINNCRGTPINISRTNWNLEANGESRQQTQQQQQQQQPPRIIRTANISTALFTDKNAKFTLKPKFLKVVRLVPGIDQTQTVFTYEEVTLLLSKYILSRKDEIFDPRNIKLALVGNDPIGDAFGVKAFHRCQVNNLLRSQLIPVTSDYPPDIAIVTENNSSPGLNVLVTEKQSPIVGTNSASSSSAAPASCYPAFPALSKAASLPASLVREVEGRTRKRNSEGEEEEQNNSKQPRITRQEGNCSVVIRPANDSDVSDTETIYSEQGYETIKVADQTQTSESEEEEDTMRNFHDVEYDIESVEEEEERPPQAMGKGKEFSSAEDTDTDVEDRRYNEPLIETRKIEQMMESVYWGDSEDDVKMSIIDDKESEKNDKVLDNVDLWKCSSCKTPNKPSLEQSKFKNFLCSKCWNLRKGWVPERPKFKRKSRKADKKLTTIQNVVMSDTETDGASDRPRFDSKASISSQDSGIGSQEFELLSQEEEHSKEIPQQSVVINRFEFLPRSISLDSTNSSSVAGNSLDLGDSGSIADPKDFPGSPLSLHSGCFPSSESSQGTSQLCTLCCQRPKDASFIHGRLAHQVCCYPCAKKLWKKQATCPVCRRKVERIVRIIQA